jgi:phage terminase small subunit
MHDAMLTARQARFIDEYLVDANATQAAIRAGSATAGAHVWASRTLRNPKVSAVLKKRLEADSERLRVGRERVISMLLTSYELAKGRKEPAAMVSASRELGRLLGYYEPSKAHMSFSSGGPFQKQLEAMPDHELVAMIASAASTGSS